MHGEFIVETDASDYCIGGVLQEDQGHNLQPVDYFSKKLTGHHAIMQPMSASYWPL